MINKAIKMKNLRETILLFDIVLFQPLLYKIGTFGAVRIINPKTAVEIPFRNEPLEPELVSHNRIKIKAATRPML